MNIQNITALAEQIQSLGFENAGYSILKRICFKPGSFFLSQKIVKGKEQLNFHLYFEKDGKKETYALLYYDAILQKEMALSGAIINGIDIAGLEKRMAEIDWKLAFDFEIKRQWDAEDKSSWEKEHKIASLIEELKSLEASEEGKGIAIGLKLKFWAGIPYQELVGSISPLKNKTEISQRFYLFDGEAGISADEAYRFLQNKYLEKQMQAKRKLADEQSSGENGGSKQASFGNGGLLQKKRLSRTKIGKGKKAAQK